MRLTTLSFIGWLLVGPIFAQEAEAPNAEDIALPPSYTEQARASGTVLELSLNDAIRLALANNLEIAIEDFNEDLNREQIVGTEGFYDPVLDFTVGWSSIERPTTRTLDAGRGILSLTQDNFTFNSALRQNVPGGGILSLRFNNNRNFTNSEFNFINPSYGSNFGVEFTQPLMQGFRQTATERNLKIFNLDTDITESQFRQRVSEIVQRAETQYWELVFAIENHELQRESMQLALVQYDNNRKRVEIGVEAPIEITSARAEVSNREQQMIQSEVQIINAQNQMKRLLAPDPNASIWNLTLIPTDKPQMEEVQINLREAVDTALERRPELEQLRLNLEQNEVDRNYWKQQGKPQLNLVFGLTSIGTSGTVFTTDPNQLGRGAIPDPTSPFFGNVATAWSQVFGFDFVTYDIGVNVQIPLGNRESEARRAQVAITERQLLSRMKDAQQGVIVEVRNAFEEIATQKKRLEAATMARQLQEEQLEGEMKRFQAGLSTNFEVLRFQRDLAQAQVQELRALVDYQQAVTDLRQATYTIVDENDIVLARRD